MEYDGKKRLAEHKEIEGAELYSANTFFYAGYIAGPLIFPGEDVDPESDSELVPGYSRKHGGVSCRRSVLP